MKNQNDMIFSIAAVVLALICLGVFFFTKPKTVTPPAPTVVPVTDVTVNAGSVVYANSLPGGSNNSFGSGPGGNGRGPVGAGGGGRGPAGAAGGGPIGGPAGFSTPGGGAVGAPVGGR